MDYLSAPQVRHSLLTARTTLNAEVRILIRIDDVPLRLVRDACRVECEGLPPAMLAQRRLGVRHDTKDSPAACTHLVSPKILRTRRFLVAMNFGPSVLHERWIHDCISARRILRACASAASVRR